MPQRHRGHSENSMSFPRMRESRRFNTGIPAFRFASAGMTGQLGTKSIIQFSVFSVPLWPFYVLYPDTVQLILLPGEVSAHHLVGHVVHVGEAADNVAAAQFLCPQGVEVTDAAVNPHLAVTGIGRGGLEDQPVEFFPVDIEPDPSQERAGIILIQKRRVIRRRETVADRVPLPVDAEAQEARVQYGKHTFVEVVEFIEGDRRKEEVLRVVLNRELVDDTQVLAEALPVQVAEGDAQGQGLLIGLAVLRDDIVDIIGETADVTVGVPNAVAFREVRVVRLVGELHEVVEGAVALRGETVDVPGGLEEREEDGSPAAEMVPRKVQHGAEDAVVLHAVEDTRVAKGNPRLVAQVWIGTQDHASQGTAGFGLGQEKREIAGAAEYRPELGHDVPHGHAPAVEPHGEIEEPAEVAPVAG